MPPTPSLWPFRYFVVECSTMSAPSSSGRWKNGDMNVLSTIRRAPSVRQAEAMARRSAMRNSGFVGVSTNTIEAPERMASVVAERSLVSTQANSNPCRRNTCSPSRKVPP